MSARKRIEYVDVAKGIAILCVVAGHTFAAYDPGSLQNKFIYSFHMPLFFILSGFFYKPQEFKKAFWKKVKSLLVPYFVINALRCLVALYQSGFENMLTGYFFPALYGNGSTPKIALSLFDVKIVGMTWFLMALFMCQVMYLSLEEFSKKYGAPMWMLVFITAITGIGFNDKVWLPFSIQPAMGALIFYHAGRLMRGEKGAGGAGDGHACGNSRHGSRDVAGDDFLCESGDACQFLPQSGILPRSHLEN